jgi:hypothetical protein
MCRCVDTDAGVNRRQVEDELDIWHSIIWRVLHEHLFYPCNIQRVQSLQAPDSAARGNIRQCFVQRNADHFFPPSVLFTDEALFGRVYLLTAP